MSVPVLSQQHPLRVPSELRLTSYRELSAVLADSTSKIRSAFATVVSQQRRIASSFNFFFAHMEDLETQNGLGNTPSPTSSTFGVPKIQMLPKLFALSEMFSACEETLQEQDPFLAQLEELNKTLCSELNDALYTLTQRDNSRQNKAHYEAKVKQMRDQEVSGSSKLTRNEGKLALARQDCAELQDRARSECEKTLEMARETISKSEQLLSTGLVGVGKGFGGAASKCWQAQRVLEMTEPQVSLADRSGVKEERNSARNDDVAVSSSVGGSSSYPNNLAKAASPEPVNLDGESSQVFSPASRSALPFSLSRIQPMLLQDDGTSEQTLSLVLSAPLVDKIERVFIGGNSMEVVSATDKEVTVKGMFPFEGEQAMESWNRDESTKELEIRVEAKGVEA